MKHDAKQKPMTKAVVAIGGAPNTALDSLLAKIKTL